MLPCPACFPESSHLPQDNPGSRQNMHKGMEDEADEMSKNKLFLETLRFLFDLVLGDGGEKINKMEPIGEGPLTLVLTLDLI